MPYNTKHMKSYPLEEFISRKYGYEFVGQGDELQLSSGGETHSCFVNRKKNTFKWFARSVGGTIIDFVMAEEEVGIKGAMDIISDFMKGMDKGMPIRKMTEVEKKEVRRIDSKMITGTISKLSDRGVNYWAERGIPASVLEQASVGQIYRYGKDYFTFPVYDFKLRPVFFKMRLCPWEEGEKGASFPSGHNATIYGRQFIRSTDSDFVIAEGESDVLSCLLHDSAAISSTGGAGTWKDEWSKEINTWENIKKITLAYDQDEAGEKGQEVVMKSLKKHASRIELEEYMWPPDHKGDLCDLLTTL